MVSGPTAFIFSHVAQTTVTTRATEMNFPMNAVTAIQTVTLNNGVEMTAIASLDTSSARFPITAIRRS